MMNLFYKTFFIFCLLGTTIQAQFSNDQLKKIDVLNYDFNIDINDQDNNIQAVSYISIMPLQDVDSFYLQLIGKKDDGKGMTVTGVEINNQVINNYKQINDKIVFKNPQKWKKGIIIHLEIVYSGRPIDGLYINKNKYGKRTFFGDNWPNRAHYWLPVIDHPSDKASLSFHIAAPSHYQIIASGEKVAHKHLKNHIDKWDFVSKTALPTKVMVFAAADFKVKNFPPVKLSEKTIEVSSWIYKDSPDQGFDDYKCAINVLKFYDSLIGPYSYDKLANVQSKTRFGGMENAGNIFYNENSVDGFKRVENLVAHEIGHQWFGNAVSEKNWRDIWLSEGFATYLTDLYLEHKYGRERFNERMKMERNKVIRFQKSSDKPIVHDENHNLMRLLNPNSYEKGAWVLHMLRHKIGDKLFFNSLQSYYKKYRNKNASTADFIREVEMVSKQNLDAFFKQWLYQSGLPKLKIDWQIRHDKLLIDVQQMSNLFDFELPILIKFKADKMIKVLNVKQQNNHFEILLPKSFSRENISVSLDPNVNLLFEQIVE